MNATIKASKSEAAMLAHTPSMPKNSGNINRNGIRKISWRVSDKNIDSFGLPIDWKKLVITICMPTIGNRNADILKPLLAIFISSGSIVKKLLIVSGITSVIIHPTIVIAPPMSNPLFNVCLTRSQLFAPKLKPNIGCIP